ncbi:MAG TPA: hypothetical protein VF549_04230 [Solirubrobacteraceae bacterium]
MRRAIAALAAAALAGCGTPSADLFVVERTGDLPDARLTLRVGDGGTVRCDGGPEKPFSNDDLLEARQIAKDIAPLLDKGTTLPPRTGSQLRFRIEAGEGVARFADNSADLPRPFAAAMQLTRKLAKEVCGKER